MVDIGLSDAILINLARIDAHRREIVRRRYLGFAPNVNSLRDSSYSAQKPWTQRDVMEPTLQCSKVLPSVPMYQVDTPTAFQKLIATALPKLGAQYGRKLPELTNALTIGATSILAQDRRHASRLEHQAHF
jgi:hypothetical protein